MIYDIQEGLQADSSIEDDQLQKQSQGWVNPYSFTHGSSEQRVKSTIQLISYSASGKNK